MACSGVHTCLWRRLVRCLSAKSTREPGLLQRGLGNGARVVVGALNPRQGLRGLHLAPAFRLYNGCSESRPSVMGDILSPAPPSVGPEPQHHRALPHVLAQVWESAGPARSQERGHHTSDQVPDCTPPSSPRLRVPVEGPVGTAHPTSRVHTRDGGSARVPPHWLLRRAVCPACVTGRSGDGWGAEGFSNP